MRNRTPSGFSEIENKNRALKTLKPEEGTPQSVDWSPDGTRLVVRDSYNGIEVWTVEGKRLWRRVDHSNKVYAQVCHFLKLAEVLVASLSESDSPEPIILLLSLPFSERKMRYPKSKTCVAYSSRILAKPIRRFYPPVAKNGTPLKPTQPIRPFFFG